MKKIEFFTEKRDRVKHNTEKDGVKREQRRSFLKIEKLEERIAPGALPPFETMPCDHA